MSMTFNADATDVPAFNKFFAPTIRALRHFGGTATVDQISEFVAQDLALNTKQRTATHPKLPERNLLRFRACWARTFLRKSGIITSEARGVWQLTPAGQTMPSLGKRREKIILRFFRDACAARTGV